MCVCVCANETESERDKEDGGRNHVQNIYIDIEKQILISSKQEKPMGFPSPY